MVQRRACGAAGCDAAAGEAARKGFIFLRTLKTGRQGGAETIGSKPYLCVELLSRESAAVSDGSPSLNNQPVNNPTSGIIHLASIG